MKLLPMTLCAALAPVLLGGCVHDYWKWSKCNARHIATTKGLIGQPYSKKMQERIANRTHVLHQRVVRPGEMVTQDYRNNRITVDVDERDVITAIRCG